MCLYQVISRRGISIHTEATPSVHAAHTSTHDPLAVITDSDALTRLFKLEVLQKLDPAGEFRITLETSFPLSGKPFWKRPGA